MENESALNTVERMLNRAEAWHKDAEKRGEWVDYYYYSGQKDILNNVIKLLK